MPSSPTQNKFFDAIDILIRLNEDSRLEHADHCPQYMNRTMWLVEFGTLNVNVARQSDKTTYIQERAACADLVVTRNEHLKRAYYRDMCATVLTSEQLIAGVDRYFRGSLHTFDRVWFDESWSSLSQNQRIQIYQYFSGTTPARACANMFIMFGTAV